LEFARTINRPEFVVGTIARWLGIRDAEAERLLHTVPTTPDIDPEVLKSIEMMEATGAPALVAQARELRARFMPADLPSLRSEVQAALGFDPLGDDERGRTLAAQLESYQRVLSLPLLTLSRLQQQAATPGRAARYAEYAAVLSRAGFDRDGTFLVTEFPVVYLAVGFTRGGFEPAEADLVPYRDRAARGQATKTAIYTSRTDTEALVFRLDEGRVGRWMVANRLVSQDEVTGPGATKRWFAAHLEGYESQLPPEWDQGDPDPSSSTWPTRAVFELIHTVAHQMLRALAVDSGFSEEALSEYLFPHDLAFAIHPNGGTEFTIGALRTVLEQNLDEIVTRAVENDTCIYDPNCMAANRGSDHGCLQLAETSCQSWNWFLSRWHLFGWPDQGVIGYWDPRLDA
jgi:hypothetical protein